MSHDRPSDQTVAKMTKRLARGDEGAWRWLHENYFPILHAAAVSRGASANDSADLVQRTYLRVLRHAKRFRTEPDLRSWLCCLLRCETIDAARSGQRRSTLLEKFQHREELKAAHPPPEIDGLLDELEPADRELITHHYLHGWSQRELAAERGTSTKAIESRLARLRKHLRQTLETPNHC